MRSRAITFCACVALAGALDSAGAQAPPSAAGQELPKHLVGTWRSEPDRTQLTGAFEESVWGRNATSERLVELRIERTGEATLTVTSRILDAKGRVVRGPTSIEESRLRIGGATQTTAVGTDHAVTVVSAERRYPDDPAGTWPLDGLKVRVITREDRDGIELRYDTPEGRGSFWATLTRGGKANPRRAEASTAAAAG
jgi:hypothetical protein